MIIKDWEQKDNYNFPEDFPDKRWAWEFLRRNTDYQECWEEALSTFSQEPSARWKDPSSHDFVIEDNRAYDFGLATGLLNPATDKPLLLNFIPERGVQFFTGTGDELIGPLPSGTVAVIFEIGEKIGPQIEMAKQRLSHVQATKQLVFEKGYVAQDATIQPVPVKSRRLHKGNWALYLQVLDARLAGVGNSEIGKTLFPHYPNDYPEMQQSKHASRIYYKARLMAAIKFREIVSR